MQQFHPVADHYVFLIKVAQELWVLHRYDYCVHIVTESKAHSGFLQIHNPCLYHMNCMNDIKNLQNTTGKSRCFCLFQSYIYFDVDNCNRGAVIQNTSQFYIDEAVNSLEFPTHHTVHEAVMKCLGLGTKHEF
jgi:hypothetical protein